METLVMLLGVVLRLAIPLGLLTVLSTGMRRWDSQRSHA